MGLIKYFEQREKKQGFKRAFNREEQNGSNPLGGYFEKRHMNERIERARLQGYETEKIKQARIKGKQQAQGGFGLKGFASGAVGVMQEIGSLAPKGGGSMFDLPGSSSVFDFGMPGTATRPHKKKHKGKKVTIYIK